MGSEECIRVLIVDDEPLSRKKIRYMLEGDPEIDIVGECSNGAEAIEMARREVPDLIFLDVHMPEKDGFAVIEDIGSELTPAIIFVTAYDHYAVQAFEVSALDYLLKPFDRERFERALDRAKSHILGEKAATLDRQILSALEEIRARQDHLDRLVIKTNGHVFFVKVSDIAWIKAEGNYVRLHVGKESYLLRDTISGLEAQLDPSSFIRVHRSTIVNIDRIQELQPWFHGEYRVVMQDGAELTLSRTYREKLNGFLARAL
ncbi:MAG: LytTR family DNA-binding domain-containing protein [Blastocatellia bacterium]|nr:LytTR family DNA-binding domain-containing protein [Blastocatellia bacterium]